MADLSHIGRTVYIASDHAGFAHKEAMSQWLAHEGWQVEDCGPASHDPEDDFPALIAPAAAAVASDPMQRCAIIIGGSGQGEAMVANRFPGVRATVYYGGPDDIITLSRAHNDANVLSLGARFVSLDDAMRVTWMWLHASSSTEAKYERRNQALDTITNHHEQI